MSELTVIGDFDRVEEGYIVIAPLSEEIKQAIYGLQKKLTERFSLAALWLPKDEQLHVTFAHVISPDADYPTDRAKLYDQLEPDVKRVLTQLMSDVPKIEITFDTIEVSPAAIVIKGYDDGSFDKLRAAFMDGIQLPEETRRPPTSIHSTIARFRAELDLADLKKLVEGLSISVKEDMQELHLIHEKKIYVQAHDVIARFSSV
jgi:hypothetical protein